MSLRFPPTRWVALLCICQILSSCISLLSRPPNPSLPPPKPFSPKHPGSPQPLFSAPHPTPANLLLFPPLQVFLFLLLAGPGPRTPPAPSPEPRGWGFRPRPSPDVAPPSAPLDARAGAGRGERPRAAPGLRRSPPRGGAVARPRPSLMRSGETPAGGGQSGPSVPGGADGWSPDSNRGMRTRWRRSRPRPRCSASPGVPSLHSAAPNPAGFGEA